MNRTKKIKKIIYVKKDEYDKCKTIVYNPYVKVEKEKKIVSTTKTKKKTNKSIIKMINIPFTNKNITPNNDFYNYINFDTIKQLKEKYKNISTNEKYYVQVDNFRITQDKVNNELVEIIENVIKNPQNKKEQLIKKVFHSLITDSRKEFQFHLKNLCLTYDTYVKNDDLWGFLGYINKNEIVRWLCPINWSVIRDLSHKNKYINLIGFPSFTLYNTMLYFFFDIEPSLTMKQKNEKSYKYNKYIINEYLKYIQKMNDRCFGSNKVINPMDVFNVQKEILYTMACNNIKTDSDNNVVKKEDAHKYNFEWKLFAKALGYKTLPDVFSVESLNYLSCVCKLLKDNWKTPKWKSFWIYIFLKEMSIFNIHLRDIPFDLNRKIILGQPTKTPPKIFALIGMSYMFNYFLSKEYVEKYYNEYYVNYVENLFGELINIFKKIITNNKWLSPVGKKNALLKLNHITLNVGIQKNVVNDPLLDYKDNDAWYNLSLFSEWKTKKLIELVTNKVSPIDYNFDSSLIDWRANKLTGKQCYIVNSFYTSTVNEVYIPLAYLQKPFITLDNVGIEYIMAYIGGTLTHEMSHSLDANGSKFNYNGVLEDIFTKRDKTTYEKIANDIILQYETAAKKDGYNFDASISIGEDMADISGLAITTEYLRDYYVKNKVEIPVIISSLGKFFAYYAISNNAFIYKNAIPAQLITNPHPMNKYRVNVPLSRLELFRNVYNVKKNNGMWWHNLSKIWSE
jgi:predicted metalloendopeptidase